MLEQQQGQLVSGLQELYRRLKAADAGEGLDLHEIDGNPLTHDILAALNLLEKKPDRSGEIEAFEEDCSKLHSKLLGDRAEYVPRRGPFSSEPNHTVSKPPSSSPLSQHAVTRSQQPHTVQPPTPPSFLEGTLFVNDPLLYQPEWYQAVSNMTNPNKCAVQIPDIDDSASATEIFLASPSEWQKSTNCAASNYSNFVSFSQENAFANNFDGINNTIALD